MNMTEARREFDAWVERDYVTGRPELCDWTSWMEAGYCADAIRRMK